MICLFGVANIPLGEVVLRDTCCREDLKEAGVLWLSRNEYSRTVWMRYMQCGIDQIHSSALKRVFMGLVVRSQDRRERIRRERNGCWG